MGIKILSTMNVEVFAISHSPNKEEEAKRIGANHFVLSSSVTAMNKLKRDHALDIILDTVGALPSEEDASPSTPEGGSPTSREDKRDKDSFAARVLRRRRRRARNARTLRLDRFKHETSRNHRN